MRAGQTSGERAEEPGGGEKERKFEQLSEFREGGGERQTNNVIAILFYA